MTQLTVEWVPINRLYGSPSNPRKNDEAVPHVAASIRRFGWQQPIVARPSGEVVAGNTRLKAAMSLGATEVPVAWFEFFDAYLRACLPHVVPNAAIYQWHATRRQTPDEIYFGTGDDVPAKLVDARQAARQARLEVNRERRCAVCVPVRPIHGGGPVDQLAS